MLDCSRKAHKYSDLIIELVLGHWLKNTQPHNVLN